MTNDHNRRVTDSAFWKWIPLWPVFTGVVMAAVAMGGYIATLRYMGSDLKAIHEDIKTIHAWINVHEQSTADKNVILEHVIALEEGQDKRIRRLEDHEDGGFFLRSQRRGGHSLVPLMQRDSDDSAG